MALENIRFFLMDGILRIKNGLIQVITVWSHAQHFAHDIYAVSTYHSRVPHGDLLPNLLPHCAFLF